MTTETRDGLVITHLGKALAVEAEGGDLILCHTRKRIVDVAVGDRVLWEPCDGTQGLVVGVLPRHSVLVRPARGGKLRTVAANLDRVWVVVALQPEPDFLLVDQILAVCEHRGIDAALLLNKTDLPGDFAALDRSLSHYRIAGYRVYRISVRQGFELHAVQAALREGCSMLTGQSGVGKSSLTNALLPDKSLRTNELSAKSGLGRHTTTAATLYHLPDGGDLIDSPGVTVFGLAEMTARDLAAGFREFRAFLADCRFGDCSHTEDKGCAVRTAVENGRISVERYRRYRRLLEKGATTSFFGGHSGTAN